MAQRSFTYLRASSLPLAILVGAMMPPACAPGEAGSPAPGTGGHDAGGSGGGTAGAAGGTAGEGGSSGSANGPETCTFPAPSASQHVLDDDATSYGLGEVRGAREQLFLVWSTLDSVHLSTWDGNEFENRQVSSNGAPHSPPQAAIDDVDNTFVAWSSNGLARLAYAPSPESSTWTELSFSSTSAPPRVAPRGDGGAVLLWQDQYERVDPDSPDPELVTRLRLLEVSPEGGTVARVLVDEASPNFDLVRAPDGWLFISSSTAQGSSILSRAPGGSQFAPSEEPEVDGFPSFIVGPSGELAVWVPSSSQFSFYKGDGAWSDPIFVPTADWSVTEAAVGSSDRAYLAGAKSDGGALWVIDRPAGSARLVPIRQDDWYENVPSSDPLDPFVRLTVTPQGGARLFLVYPLRESGDGRPVALVEYDPCTESWSRRRASVVGKNFGEGTSSAGTLSDATSWYAYEGEDADRGSFAQVIVLDAEEPTSARLPIVACSYECASLVDEDYCGNGEQDGLCMQLCLEDSLDVPGHCLETRLEVSECYRDADPTCMVDDPQPPYVDLIRGKCGGAQYASCLGGLGGAGPE